MALASLKIEDLPHYTYDDYIRWEGQWELINGIPYAMGPMPSIEHQDTSGTIYRYISELLEHCPKCKVLLPVDWEVEENTVVQPDVLVVCGEGIKGKKLLIPPVLIFEVLSPSTTRKDKILKYRLYQEYGVKYYCIVDPETRYAEMFKLYRDLYKKEGDFKEGKMIFDLGSCTIVFDFKEIFK
jgi:Uma2 family endonuclease